MNKKYALIFIAFLCSFFYGFGQSDIIISQYIETNSGTTPKGIEIFNVSGSDIDFSITNLDVRQGTNGGACASIFTLTTGVLLADEVWVIGTNAAPNLIAYAIANGTSLSGTTNFNFSFNGDDALQLYLGGVLQDQFGICGSDPGASWSGSGVSTANNNLQVKNGICDGDIDGWTDPSERFDQIANGSTMTGFGNAPASCISCTDTLDYYNLQSPANGSITVGSPFNVFAKTYEPGVTNDGDFPDDAGTGIEVWIGYNTLDNDPSNGGWTWIPAGFNTQIVNDDEFVAEIGSTLASGTYYYASRFRLNGCGFTYGGYDIGGGDGIWDGVNDVNGVLTVDQVDFCNLQFPEVGNIVSGGVFDVFARVYEPGITDASNIAPGAGIECWIGYSLIDATVGNSINNATTRTDFESSDWTWVPAGYNQDYGNDDEFFVDIGSCISPGNYVYASRFSLNGGAYSYGGIEPPNGGNFWDGSTYISGTLTVTDPPLADVVITEIMYNSTGTDDEWIEICNVSGSIQDISNYIIDVTGFGTVYTFPCNTTIANGDCITIDLGDGGGADFNVDCPFIADYSNGLGNGTLGNTTDTITIYASNGSTIADIVTYDDGDDTSTDNNGSSYHIVDTSLDNSNTNSNWEAVEYGGSSGANTLLPNCLPAGVEINVEGNLGNFPDIMDGDTTPIGTDNTLFAAQFVGASQSKSYRIQSLLATDVVISNLTITGHSADFTVTSTPASPVSYITPSILEITFSPTVAGTRTAVVHIFNNDSDEAEYTFTIQGEGKCVGVIDSISPASGSEGTIVTVSATGIDLNTATASFNTIPVTILNYIVATDELEVTVPTGATDGNLELVDGFGCTGIIAFNVIDNTIAGCGGGGTLPTDLFISEITDSTTGGMTYIEIYNGTGATVNLNGYSLEIIANGNSSGNTVTLNNVLLANDDTYVVAIGVVASPDYVDPNADTCPVNISGSPVGNGELADQTSTVGGINKKDNEHDVIRLIYSGSTVDEFGVFQDKDWMDSTIITGNRGFNFRRLATASVLPNPTFLLANLATDWNVIDWAGAGLTSCSTNDYSHIGIFDFSTGTPPSIPAVPIINSGCNNATISVTANEGTDPAGLTYQWFYSAPGDPGWTEVPNTAAYDYASTVTNTLSILDTSGLVNYQYYCEVREDDATCSAASDAVKLTLPTATWTITGWSSPPTSSKIAIIDYPYNTGNGTGGQTSFNACSLIINSGNTLTISNTTYVDVVNDVTNYGTIDMQTQGSFVQQGDGAAAGTFTNSGAGIANIGKTTADFDSTISEINYTYWSSPINDPSNPGFGEDISTVFPSPVGNRKYYFTAQNYIDSFIETDNNNDNTTDPGQDDIDDNANDWTFASGAMEIGRGYAVTTNGVPPMPGIYNDASTVFSGALNTGDITVTLYKNNNEINDNNWNFIGNPYPSAISVDDFFSANVTVDDVGIDPNENPDNLTEGAIFLWSQSVAPDANSNGNEQINFAQSDYAIINRVTQTAGTSGTTPLRFIPSGQGFFVAFTENLGTPVNSVTSGNVVFTNSMRRTGNNTQFFEANNSTPEDNINLSYENNILWVNLTSDNGVFSQIAVAYADGATDSYDGWSYDTPRNLSTGTYATLYSVIDSTDGQFAIQGKSPESLTLDEIVPLGFDTSINEATLYKLSITQLEGNFMNQNDVFVKDNLLNKIHNLKESDYSFTSEVGEFKDRFEILFTKETLSLVEIKIDNNSLQIIELQNGNVQFKVSSPFEMKSIEIIDLHGRTLYKLDAQGNSQTFSLDNLSQATYLAKVKLTNGYVINKKALKRK